jgi:hypothetical protein
MAWTQTASAWQKRRQYCQIFHHGHSSIQANFVGCSKHNLNFTQFWVQDSTYKAIFHTVEHSTAIWPSTPMTGTMSCVIGNQLHTLLKPVGTTLVMVFHWTPGERQPHYQYHYGVPGL